VIVINVIDGAIDHTHSTGYPFSSSPARAPVGIIFFAPAYGNSCRSGCSAHWIGPPFPQSCDNNGNPFQLRDVDVMRRAPAGSVRSQSLCTFGSAAHHGLRARDAWRSLVLRDTKVHKDGYEPIQPCPFRMTSTSRNWEWIAVIVTALWKWRPIQCAEHPDLHELPYAGAKR